MKRVKGPYSKYFPNGLKPDGHRACALTGKPMKPGSAVVWFGGFIKDEDDPFWMYSGWPMLREAFDEWEKKGAFLARWRESTLAELRPGQRVLVNEPDYLVLLSGSGFLSVFFFAHGFPVVCIPREHWRDFENLLLTAPRRTGEFVLGWGRGRLEVRPNKDRICLIRKPPVSRTDQIYHDRILLSQSEWEHLMEVVHTAALRLRELT